MPLCVRGVGLAVQVEDLSPQIPHPPNTQGLRGITDAVNATLTQNRWDLGDLSRRLGDARAFAAQHGLHTDKNYSLDHPYAAPQGQKAHFHAAPCFVCFEEVKGLPLSHRGGLRDEHPVQLSCGHAVHVGCARSLVANGTAPIFSVRGQAELLNPLKWPPRCGSPAEPGCRSGAFGRCLGFLPAELALQMVESPLERERLRELARTSAALSGSALVRCRGAGAGACQRLLLTCGAGGSADPAASRPLAFSCSCGARTCSGRGGVLNCCGRPHGAVTCDVAAGLEQRLASSGCALITQALLSVQQLLAQEPANHVTRAIAAEKEALLEPLHELPPDAVALHALQEITSGEFIVATVVDEEDMSDSEDEGRVEVVTVASEVERQMREAAVTGAVAPPPSGDWSGGDGDFPVPLPPGLALGPFTMPYGVFASDYAKSLLHHLAGCPDPEEYEEHDWSGVDVPPADLLLLAAAPLVAAVARQAHERLGLAAALVLAHMEECAREATAALRGAEECRSRVWAAPTARRAQREAEQARAFADACARIASAEKAAARQAHHLCALKAHAAWVVTQARAVCPDAIGDVDDEEYFAAAEADAELVGATDFPQVSAAAACAETARRARQEAEAARRAAERRAAAPGGTAEAEAAEAEDAAGEARRRVELAMGIRPCPACLTPVQKSAACNAMHCAACTHEYCWSCFGCVRSTAPQRATGHVSSEVEPRRTFCVCCLLAFACLRTVAP